MPVLEALVNLIAPHVCVSCETEGYLLCAACRRVLPAPIPRCYVCERPCKNGITCGRCVGALESVRSVTTYGGAAKALITHMKFHNGRAGAREIADMVGKDFSEDFLEGPYVVVPVPTSPRRVRQRGYDQSALIARGFARSARLPYASLLLRQGNQQQHGATRVVRKRQLAHAYQVLRPDAVTGKRIILIDDVVTTGATLEAAASVLSLAGAVSIDALVFAQA